MMKQVSAAEYWARAEAFGEDFEGSPCMVLPNRPEKTGYVRLGQNQTPAHRLLYEAFVGPIAPGLRLDHRCASTNGLRSCVNFEHMEPVTDRVNILRGVGRAAINARKTHCKHGHPLSSANLFRRADGDRACRTCKRRFYREWAAKNPERVRAYKRAAYARSVGKEPK